MAHKLPNAVKLIIIYFLTKCGANFTCNINKPSDCSCANIAGPISTTVLSNTDVNLRCTVEDANGNEVQWIQSVSEGQPKPLGIDPTIPCCPRYSMNTVGGNYSLTISNVTVSDQGSYFCQIPDCLKSSNTAELTVDILPTGPTIQNEINGYVNVIASETQNWLVCSATNAKPAAIVRWYENQNGTLLDADSATTTIPNANQAYDTTASYSFQPTAADNDAKYTCQISGDAVSLSGRPYITEIITIFVTEKPAVFTTGVANGGTFVVDINEEATVTCEATNPNPNVQIDWYRANVIQNTTMTSVETNGTYYFSNSIPIFGNDANDGVLYQCNVAVPGYADDRFYQDNLRFTVSVYQFPYAAVIGGSIGGLILIILLIILIVFLVRRSKKKKKKANEERIRREIQATVIANENADEQNGGGVRNGEVIQDEQVVPKEVTEIEQALKVDLGYDSDSETSRKYDEESSSEEDSEYESVGPPSGETFSISSSMQRSRRGSPVVMYSDLDEESTYSTDVEAAAIPSPHASAPVYYTRETGTRMLTDV